MPIQSALIASRNWRQGSVFAPTVSSEFIRANRAAIAIPGFEIGEDAILMVISHSCDIVHSGIYEPRIEVCPAVHISELNGNYTNVRNPRCLQLSLLVENKIAHYEFRAASRFYLPRKVLETNLPNAKVIIGDRELGHLRAWLARRFQRTALPTEFDKRIDRKARDKIRQCLRQVPPHSLHSIVIAINPDDAELSKIEDEYQLQLIALMEPDQYENAQIYEAVANEIEKIEAILGNCDGIDLQACEVESLGNITVAEYRDFSVWDYDHLSWEQNIDPPEQID